MTNGQFIRRMLDVHVRIRAEEIDRRAREATAQAVRKANAEAELVANPRRVMSEAA